MSRKHVTSELLPKQKLEVLGKALIDYPIQSQQFNENSMLQSQIFKNYSEELRPSSNSQDNAINIRLWTGISDSLQSVPCEKRSTKVAVNEEIQILNSSASSLEDSSYLEVIGRNLSNDFDVVHTVDSSVNEFMTPSVAALEPILEINDDCSIPSNISNVSLPMYQNVPVLSLQQYRLMKKEREEITGKAINAMTDDVPPIENIEFTDSNNSIVKQQDNAIFQNSNLEDLIAMSREQILSCNGSENDVIFHHRSKPFVSRYSSRKQVFK